MYTTAAYTGVVRVCGLRDTFKVFSFRSVLFSARPLNIETYRQRLRAFGRPYTSRDLVDLIRANRSLQRANPLNRSHQFLDLVPTYDNASLELDLWQTVEKHFRGSPKVLEKYLFTSPEPVAKLASLYRHGVDRFSHQLSAQNRIDHRTVAAVVQFFLRQRDYRNAVQFVEETVGSAAALAWYRGQLMGRAARLVAGVAAVLAAQWFFLPLWPLAGFAALNGAAVGLAGYAHLRPRLVPQLGRVQFRPYVNAMFQYQHTAYMGRMNKIVTHFEEHNEVTIRNFHHSQLRRVHDWNVFRSNEMVIEAPSRETRVELAGATPSEDANVLSLQQYFRQVLLDRSMVVGDLQEELNFLEFWHTGGENFDWVEPDQDPAEWTILRHTNTAQTKSEPA